MAEIINLRGARKRKARAEKDRAAAENRVRFGRPKAESLETDRTRRKDDNRFDGHKIETEE